MTITAINGGCARILGATLLATVMLGMSGCGDIHARSEFTTLVMDKSEDEVVKNVGKPASVDTSDPSRVAWTYTSATYEPGNANSRDSKAIVIFKPNPSTGKLRATDVKFD